MVLGSLLNWDGVLGVTLKSVQGNWATSETDVGNLGFILSSGGKLGVSLELQWVLLEPFDLPKGSEVSFQVARGN